jgi:hypothetical protein
MTASAHGSTGLSEPFIIAVHVLRSEETVEMACKWAHRDSAKKPIFRLTSLLGLLYSLAAGMTALVVAAAKTEETTDEGAYESLACVRSASPACAPRPISIAQ